MRSKKRRELACSSFVFALPQGYGHDLRSRDFQYCQRLLCFDTSNTSHLEATASLAPKDCGLRSFHDRTDVSTLWFDVRLRVGTYQRHRACIASSLGLYYRILLSHDDDWTRHVVGLGSTVWVQRRWSLFHTANRPSIIEMALGTICGCMPYLASKFKRWGRKSSQPYWLKVIKSRITFKFNRRSDKPNNSSSFKRVESPPNQDHHLATNILGSVKGAGKFIDSRNSKLREWLDRTTISQQGHKEETIPENQSVWLNISLLNSQSPIRNEHE